MADEMREIDGVSNPSNEALRSASDKVFVAQSIDGVGQAISRYSVDPESVRKAFGAFRDSKLNDAQIAEGLGKIELFDKELQNIDLSTDDGLAKATAVADGKLISTIEATTDKKFQTRLQRFRDDILHKTGAAIVMMIGGKKGAVRAMSLIMILSTACSALPAMVGPVAPAFYVTEVPTLANTQEPTTAPTEIPTVKPEVAPTAKPLELKTDLSGNILENLSIVKVEDIESGLYTKKEQELLQRGGIKAFPGRSELSSFYNSDFYEGLFENNILSVYTKDVYDGKKGYVPNQVSDLSMTEIDGQKVLVVGVGYLNIDESVSFFHYKIQNFDDEKTIETLKKMIAGEYEICPIISMKETPKDSEFDYSGEKVMLEGYETEEDAREALFKGWVATGGTGNSYKYLENKLLMFFLVPKAKK